LLPILQHTIQEPAKPKHFQLVGPEAHLEEVIRFGHCFDVFLLQPFQRFLCIMARYQIGLKKCFVIFVLLFDEFDHFAQTFGGIDIGIDSLIVPMKNVETPALEIAYHTKSYGSNLSTALYFTVSGVFSTSSIPKPLIPDMVMYENEKILLSIQEEGIRSNEY
jgi:hypothetical protein